MRIQLIRGILILLAYLLLPSCSGGGCKPNPSAQTQPSAASPQQPVARVLEIKTMTVTPAGQRMEMGDGIQILFPPSALVAPAEVTIKRMEPTSLPGNLGTPVAHFSCTAIVDKIPVGKFAKPIEIILPLPPSQASDAKPVFLAIVSTQNPSECEIEPVIPDQREGKPCLVLSVKHFSEIDVTRLPIPPATAGPLDIPIYKQGDTLYCWAACLQMLCRSEGNGLGSTFNILGSVSSDFVNNLDMHPAYSRGKRSGVDDRLAEVIRARAGVDPLRYLWDCRDGFFNTAAGNASNRAAEIQSLVTYIKHEVGTNGRPVYLGSDVRSHAFVILGYDAGGRFIVHDPEMVPKIGYVSNKMGYQHLTPVELGLDPGKSAFHLTVVIPATQLNPDRPMITIDMPNGSIWFFNKDNIKEYYTFTWVATESNGECLARTGGRIVWKPRPDGTGPRPNAARQISSEATTLCIGDPAESDSGLRLINSSPTQAADVDVEITIVNRTTSNLPVYNSKPIPTAIPPNEERRVKRIVEIDEFRDRKAAMPQEYSLQAVVRPHGGGKAIDSIEYPFILEPLGNGYWKLTDSKVLPAVIRNLPNRTYDLSVNASLNGRFNVSLVENDKSGRTDVVRNTDYEIIWNPMPSKQKPETRKDSISITATPQIPGDPTPACAIVRRTYWKGTKIFSVGDYMVCEGVNTSIDSSHLNRDANYECEFPEPDPRYYPIDRITLDVVFYAVYTMGPEVRFHYTYEWIPPTPPAPTL